ncbi:MAG: phosphate/phosphite/phosphonate ABC transporter substrate-binding protein [Pseudomonadota bacterium]
MKTPVKLLIRAFSLIVASGLCVPAANAADQPRLAALDDSAAEETLIFGIVPQQSASRLARMWGPLLARLGEDLGVGVQFRTAKDIPTFEACLAAGAYDLAYMNPVHYTIFSDAAGYLAVARQADKKLRGLIVVRKDSDLVALEDLNGAEIAFPSPGAFGASVVPRAELQARGVDFKPKYVKSHDSVYRAVAAGLMPAGGGVLRTFNAIAPDLRDQLRVIYRTGAYTPHAIAAAGRVPADIREALQDALMQINADAPDLAASVGMTGFARATDQEWDDVRALQLKAADTGISTQETLACPSG